VDNKNVESYIQENNLRKVQQRTPVNPNNGKPIDVIKGRGDFQGVDNKDNEGAKEGVNEEVTVEENEEEIKVTVKEEFKDDPLVEEEVKEDVKDDTVGKEDVKEEATEEVKTEATDDPVVEEEVKEDVKKESIDDAVETGQQNEEESNSEDTVDPFKEEDTKKEATSELMKEKGMEEFASPWDSDKSAVIGLASGYGLNVFEVFVGSLRATGYQGHIILGISKNAPKHVTDYLESQNVTMKEVVPMKGKKCTYYGELQNTGHKSTDQTCSEDHPDIKIQWGRFPMAKKWLLECAECTSGVMLTDVRDAFFQSNPFTYKYNDEPQKTPPRIMVFEEIFPNVTNNHWLVKMPVESCRNSTIFNDDSKPMLCSGSTMGSREGIIDYIDAMTKEMDYWKATEDCRSDMVGDDQSIHNYLYYTDQLPGAVAIPHRTGSIHVAGVQAAIINELEKEEAKNSTGEMEKRDWRNWLRSDYDGLFDPKTGQILNLDGKPSPQVHQFDRYPWDPITVYLNKKFREGPNEIA